MTTTTQVEIPMTWPLADVTSLACGLPRTSRLARKRTRQMTVAWALDTAVQDDAELVTGELVVNAVQAGSASDSIRLRLFCDRRHLLIEVHDTAPGIPVLRKPSDGDDSGRGLIIVNELSLRWGSRPTDGGKAVYALMAAS